jgi:hypothetical protein
MARMRPELTDEQLRDLQSRAEARVYEALRAQLPADALVIHSLRWLYRTKRGTVSEGESDFTVFLPQSGFLTIEVKGGGIALDGRTGQWSSTDKNQISHAIKDPFLQATRQRHAILDQLRGHAQWRRWTGRWLHCGHAVLFPDVRSPAQLAGPDRPIEIIGGQSEFLRLSDWISRALRFWTGAHSIDPLGSQGVDIAEQILCGSIDVKPLLSVVLEQEEEVRIRLTEQQARVLRIIGGRRRAVIGGGAGTGKTLIALEKARRVALGGKQALLVCYNRPLADVLRAANGGIPGLHVLSYHQLCERRIARAREISGRDVLSEAQSAYPGASLYDVQLPFALALANEIVPEKFDAVVVDEAQDFSDEYWLGVEDLLRDRESGDLYVFFDPNQMLYKRRGSLPIVDEPFWLTVNCRNTQHIHTAAYRYYKGEIIDPPEIAGAPISELIAEGSASQADSIVREIGRLLSAEGLAPSDVVVLVMGKPKQSHYDLFTARRLAGNVQWGVEARDQGAILLDTVARFKGLEAPIVFLWLPAVIDEEQEREALYVGLSRAKSRVYVVGSRLTCAAIRTTLEAGTAGAEHA